MESIKLNEILKRIGNKDREAFNQLFYYYYPRLLNFAKGYVKSYEDAEEVVMDVFVKLLKRRKQLTNIKNFNGYIFLAIRNQSISQINKSKPELFSNVDQEDFLIIEYNNPESKLINKELRLILHNTIENLPLRRRTVYKLIKDDGLKYMEVAKLLNISKKTVEVHIGLAVDSLRNSILNYMVDKEDCTPIRKLMSK